MIFYCLSCNPGTEEKGKKGFTPVKYHVYLKHLASAGHQEKVNCKWARVLRRAMPLENDRYVIVGLPTFMEEEKLFELAVWLAEFGVLTDMMYMRKRGLCVATVQAVGLARRGKAVARAHCLVKATSFDGNMIRVFKKETMTHSDWDKVFSGEVLRDLEDRNEELESKKMSPTENIIPTSKSLESVRANELIKEISSKVESVKLNKSMNNNERIDASKGFPPADVSIEKDCLDTGDTEHLTSEETCNEEQVDEDDNDDETMKDSDEVLNTVVDEDYGYGGNGENQEPDYMKYALYWYRF